MCGIAGIVSPHSTDLRPIQGMTEIQAHRGPDSGGLLFVTPQGPHFTASDADLSEPRMATLALGHRRLAIIDTSDSAIQPMQSKQSGCWISYNGEIYNYRELRAELQAQGHLFHTESDTEVVLHAYEQWGTECFQRFHGMWAMAIYDPRGQCLIFSRDRFGIKPLYYTHHRGQLAFASEIKALLTLEGIGRTVNLSAVKSYLSQQLVSHAEETFFASIHAFPPAHYARIGIASPQDIAPVRYWDMPAATETIAYAQAKQRFRNLFDTAIARHMRSDVPVGSCLSGGLDSSAIVCSAEPLLPETQKPFHTFTAIFPDKEIDESPWVKDVNARVGATPHWTTPDAGQFLTDLDRLVWHQDEPFTSASMYAQWSVMREAANAGIPVLLDGQGADEILCGYKKFYVQHLKLLWKRKRFTLALRESWAFLRHGDRTIFRVRDALRYLPKRFRPDLKLLDRISLPPLKQARPIAVPGLTSASSLLERQVQDLRIFSLPSLLRFEDRNSMAFSIESRVPFLDHPLVEFCLSLPEGMKLERGTSKRIMRDALQDVIPGSILARRDKMGFGAPERRWQNEKLIAAFIEDVSHPSFTLHSIIDKKALLTTLEQVQLRPEPRLGRLLFQLFILNRWAKCFNVEFPPRPTPVS